MINHLPDYIAELHKKIVAKRPVIQCITNIVTVNDCANILLAIGASPTMAHHPAEVEEIVSKVDGLVLNMGATDDLEAMMLAGCKARECGKIIVIDPVGVAASTFRRQKCLELIEKIKPDAIRGNYAEIKALIDNINTAAGVDDPTTTDGSRDIEVSMLEAASKWNTILIASGPVDTITDGREVVKVNNGDSMMSRITGSGCMSTTIVAAFLTTKNDIQGARAAVTCMGIAGEIAADKTREKTAGTMTFRHELIETISLF